MEYMEDRDRQVEKMKLGNKRYYDNRITVRKKERNLMKMKQVQNENKVIITFFDFFTVFVICDFIKRFSDVNFAKTRRYVLFTFRKYFKNKFLLKLF